MKAWVSGLYCPCGRHWVQSHTPDEPCHWCKHPFSEATYLSEGDEIPTMSLGNDID